MINPETQFLSRPLQLHPQREILETKVLAREPADRAAPRVSFYLPGRTRSCGPALRKVRLIHLIKEAEALIARDHGVEVARGMMRSFWKCEPMKLVEQSGMPLAIFHDSEFTGAMNLGHSVEEKVVVADSFHIKPVLAWLQSAPPFWLISLSAHRVKLYEGNPWELKIREVVQALPAGEAGDRTRPRAAADKERVRRFFQEAESVLHPILNQDRHPVVIAGVSWLHPLYRKVNRDPDLVSHAIQGNVERWSDEELRLSAMEILGRLVDRAKEEARTEFETLSWKGQATDDLHRVARAAVRGEVRKIMIASDQMLWGRMHPKSGTVVLHPFQLDSKDDDVLDDLAETVLSRGGRVLCLPSQELPTGSPVAAILK